MAKQVLERNIDYIEQIDGDSSYVEPMKFASLYAKFVSLVQNYNGLFDEEQTRRLRWLADYLYENYRNGFESNIKSLKIPSNVASKIAELCSSEKEKASEALTKFFSNNDIRTAKAIDDIAKKLGKEASTFESALQKKVDKLKAVASTTSKYGVRGEKTATGEFATDLIETVSKKFGSSKTIADLNWKIGTFTKDFSKFTTGLKTQADRLKKNIDKQNRFIDDITKNPIRVKENSLRKVNDLIQKSTSIGYIRTIEISHQSEIFKGKIRPVIRRIVESATKKAKEKTTLVGAIKNWLSKMFKSTKAKLHEEVYSNFKYFVLDPLKSLAKKILVIGLIKNILGAGILRYVGKAVHWAANLVKASINKVFDLVEGTISFAYNRVLVPIANVATKILGLTTKVFKKHFQNPLIDFLKTYPEAVFLGYVTGLIVNGVKRAYHSLFTKKDGEKDKTFLEMMREKHPFIDKTVKRFVKFKNLIWNKIKPIYEKALKFGNRLYHWWNGTNRQGTPPKQVLKNVATWAITKGVETWQFIKEINFVEKMRDVAINFAEVLDRVAPGYRHTMRAGRATNAIGKIVGKGGGGWVGLLLNVAGVAMLVGSTMFTLMHKPYVFGRNKLEPKKKYEEYFNIDESDLSKTKLSASQLKKLDETMKNFTPEQKEAIQKFYNDTSRDIVFEASKIDNLITRLERAEEYYDNDNVTDELKNHVYEDLENLIDDINTNQLTKSYIVDPAILKEKFGMIKGYRKQLNFLESLLNIRSAYAKQILEMLTDVSDPKRTESEVNAMLEVFQSKFKALSDAYGENYANSWGYRSLLEGSPDKFEFEDLSMTGSGLLNFGNELVKIKSDSSWNPEIQSKAEAYAHTVVSAKVSGVHTSLNVSDDMLKNFTPLGVSSRESLYRLPETEQRKVIDRLSMMMLFAVHERALEEFSKLLADLTNKQNVLSPDFAKQFHTTVLQQYDKLSQNYIAQNRGEVNGKKIAEIEKSLMQNAIYNAFVELRKDDDDEILEQINRLKDQKVFNGKTYGDSFGNEVGLTNKIFGDIEEWGNKAKYKFGLLSKGEQLVVESLEEIITTFDTSESPNKYSRRGW